MSSEDPAALRRRLEQLTVLHDVSMRIVSALDPEEVLSGVLDALGDLVTCAAAGIHLVDLDVAIPAEGPHTVTPAGSPPRLRAQRTFEAVRPERIAAEEFELVVPLVAGGRSLGALEMSLRTPLGDDDVKIVELLAATAAVALQNAHLYQETQRLAITDPLTGLSNYRHFHELLHLEVQRARRMNYAIGLLIMDLDHFKLINDRHGHPAGDEALRGVAELLRTRLRRTDVVGRIGGEEFAAVLPGDDLEQVAIVGEKLRKAVEELPPVQGGMTSECTRVTLSVGGTSLAPAELDVQLLIASADRALYKAKRNGRNRVQLVYGAGA